MSRLSGKLADRLVLAHRILVAQNVLDAFGHASLRDPENPDQFWLGSALPPSRLTVDDLLAFDLEGAPVEPTAAALFSERFIHAEIYRARPDVQAICHHHASALMPFCIGGLRLAAVSQTGAFLGTQVPLWDSADEFGDTRMLVDNAAQAASLAAALGKGSLVLMRGHGAVVTGRSIEDMVFRGVYSCREAEAVFAAATVGGIQPLSAGEIAACGEPGPPAVARGWSHWTAVLPDTGPTAGQDASRGQTS